MERVSGDGMSKVFVVGGGAAGMLAAIVAARNGHKVEIFEKNEKLGKKLFITGKGRCNLTNACDKENFFENIVTNPRFLYSSFHQFNNYDTIDFFEQLGLPTKIERGERVFPESDKSSDVIAVLKRELEQLNVIIHYHSEVIKIITKDECFHGLKVKGTSNEMVGDAVIVATGGLSYPITGSTGDGYHFAKEMGHTITDLSPSLVPIHLKETYVKDLMGLSLKNVRVSISNEQKEIFGDFGEMLFTHFGVSGPIIISASSYILPYLQKNEGELTLSIDLKPALSEEQLDARILRDFEEYINKQFKNSLGKLLPQKLIDIIVSLSSIDPEKKVNLITKEERHNLVLILKNMKFHITRLGEYKEAVVTKGGINLKEINPSTMESKRMKQVYFIGEVLDLDALTGGFNLQIAWSTAYMAGMAIE